MWFTLVLLGLLLLAGIGGITGRGVYDSRDPAYSLRLPVPSPPAELPGPDRDKPVPSGCPDEE